MHSGKQNEIWTIRSGGRSKKFGRPQGVLMLLISKECVRILDLRVQVHPGKLWVSKQRVHIVLEASKSAGAKGDVPKICGFVHPLHPL